MIKTLAIKNFQSHAKSVFNFVEGVNVIQGTSNAGKSAVIRALQWTILNQPRGTSFKRHTTADTDLLSASITNDMGVVVTRYRQKLTNAYLLQKNEKEIKFEALRTDVPNEIKIALNLDEINIQSQFTPHFLLANTAGEVARTLNTYTGLEIIDKVLKAATGNIMKTSNNISSLKSQIETQENTIASFTNIKELKKQKQKLEKLLIKYEVAWKKYNEIDTILISIEEAMPLINNLQNIITKKSIVSKAEQLIKTYQEKTKQSATLLQIINSIHATNSIIKTTQKILKEKQTTAKLTKYLTQLEIFENKYDEIVEKLTAIETINENILQNTKIIQEQKKELSKIKTCPVCGKPWEVNYEQIE